MKSHNDISGDKFAVKTRFMVTFSINYTEKCFLFYSFLRCRLIINLGGGQQIPRLISISYPINQHIQIKELCILNNKTVNLPK